MYTIGFVTTVAGSTFGLTGFADGFGTNSLFNRPGMIGISTSGVLYVPDSGNYRVRAFDTAGYCSDGYYASIPGNVSSCQQSPAGYFKPREPFSDNYYVCSQGTYSVAGATACTNCSVVTGTETFGATQCSPTPAPTAEPTAPSSQPTGYPTGEPSGTPTGQPSSQPSTANPSGSPSSQPSTAPSAGPTGVPSNQPTSDPSGEPTAQPVVWPSALPTSQPTGQPSTQPSVTPSSQPTSQPTAFCEPGTYTTGGSCHIASAGSSHKCMSAFHWFYP
jgi:hypothetical protein